MPIAKCFNYFTGILIVFKALHSLLPQSMCDQFLQLREFHTYNTRNALSDCITLPKPRTNYLKYSLAYHGAHYWNSIPLELRKIESLHEFKSQYRTKFVIFVLCAYNENFNQILYICTYILTNAGPNVRTDHFIRIGYSVEIFYNK